MASPFFDRLLSNTLFNSLSVIIPSFNRDAVVGRAIESVLAQKVANVEIEIIVIDDGSSDQTQQLIAEHFPQVTYEYQSNKGVSAARNLGIEFATHEWIALLDSDDEWLPNKIHQQAELLTQTGLLVCHTEEIWIRNQVRVNQMNKHKKMGGWIFQQCLPLCAMSPSSIVLHRSVFDQVGVFDESLPACEDYDLWLRTTSQFEVAFLETASINKYGGHVDQLSRQYWGMDRFRVLALEKILRTKTLTDEDTQAALTILNTKLTILLNGAYKHNNQQLIVDCEAKLSQWCHA